MVVYFFQRLVVVVVFGIWEGLGQLGTASVCWKAGRLLSPPCPPFLSQNSRGSIVPTYCSIPIASLETLLIYPTLIETNLALHIGGVYFITHLSSPVTCDISPSVTASVFCSQETAELFSNRDSDRCLLYSNAQIFPERRIVSVQIHPRNQC